MKLEVKFQVWVICPLLQEATGREKAFWKYWLPPIVPNKLIGLTPVVPADRFHLFHLSKSSLWTKLNKLSMFSLYLYLCVHTYTVMCVKWNILAISECCRSEINAFSLFLMKIIARLFYTTQIIYQRTLKPDAWHINSSHWGICPQPL